MVDRRKQLHRAEVERFALPGGIDERGQRGAFGNRPPCQCQCRLGARYDMRRTAVAQRRHATQAIGAAILNQGQGYQVVSTSARGSGQHQRAIDAARGVRGIVAAESGRQRPVGQVLENTPVAGNPIASAPPEGAAMEPGTEGIRKTPPRAAALPTANRAPGALQFV